MNYKSIIKMIKHHRWKSIFFKYLKLMIVSLLIPVSILILISAYLWNANTEKNTENIFSSSSQKKFFEIQSVFDTMYNNAISLYRDISVITYINSPNPAATDAESVLNLNALNTKLNSKLQSIYFEICGVCLYSKKNNYILSKDGIFSYNDFDNKAVLDKASDGSYFQGNIRFSNSDCFAVTFPLYTASYNTIDGFLIYFINCEAFKQSLGLSSEANEEVYIRNHNNEIVFAADENYSSIFKIIDKDNSIRTDKISVIKSNKNYISVLYDKNYNIDYVSTIAYSPNVSNIFTFVFIILITLVVALFNGIYSSFYIYNTLINTLTAIGLDPSTNTSNSNEIEYLKTNFINIMQSQKNMEYKLLSMLSDLKKSQMIALQAQINPHFIFNTLNVVNFMIIKLTGSDNPPAKVIRYLSEILDYTLDTSTNTTTVANEIYYIEKYIQIELIKKDYSFSTDIDVDSSLNDIQIPKFILQPIVENSINHAFRYDSDEKYLIKITVRAEKDLIILVDDNGCGIDDEAYEMLCKKLQNYNAVIESPHIGIPNVNQRIKLICGDNYGLRIQRKEHGTSIKITLPIV